MSVIQALLSGVLQGITSFLPVSSSGHLVLLGHLFGTGSSVSLKYLSAMHLGTLIAVVYVFYRDLLRLCRAGLDILLDVFYNLGQAVRLARHPDQIRYRSIMTTNYRKLFIWLLVSTIPTAFLSLLLRKPAERAAGNLLVTGTGFFLTALLLLVSSFMTASGRSRKGIRLRGAFLTGVLQGLAIIPGVSRMGMAFAGASLSGCSKKFSVRYAYLLCIPEIVGGLILEQAGSDVSLRADVGTVPCLAGIAAAALTGILFLRRAGGLVSTRDSRRFAGYCIVIGIICMVLYL